MVNGYEVDYEVSGNRVFADRSLYEFDHSLMEIGIYC